MQQSISEHRHEVMVIGGGICGSTTASWLALAGYRVVLIDQARLHEGHVAAALTPVIASDNNVRCRLSRRAATLADEFWRPMGVSVAEPCGALQLQRPASARRAPDLKAQVHAYGQPEWAHWVEADEASAHAGMQLARGGIWYPGGWLVRVPELIEHLQATPGLDRVVGCVDRLQHFGGAWVAVDGQGEHLATSGSVVLANAFDARDLLVRSELDDVLGACKRLKYLHRLAGEVTLLPADALSGGPKCIVGGDGYVLPATHGWCVSGGTYVRQASHALCSSDGRAANLTRARDLLSLDALAVSDQQSLPGWAGWRAVLPGRLPAIGPLPRRAGLFVFTAGASRGLTWSVLGARLIEQCLGGQSLDLEPEIIAAIEP